MSYVSLSNIINNENDREGRATVSYVDSSVNNTYNSINNIYNNISVDMNNVYTALYDVSSKSDAAIFPQTPNNNNTWAALVKEANVLNLNINNTYYNVLSPSVYVPWIGDNCTNLNGAFSSLPLTSAICTPKITDMSHSYYLCNSIYDCVCGPKVSSMYYAYAMSNNKSSLSSTNKRNVVIGPKVANSSYLCNNLRASQAGTLVIAPGVTNIYYTMAGTTFNKVYIYGNITKATGFVGDGYIKQGSDRYHIQGSSTIYMTRNMSSIINNRYLACWLHGSDANLNSWTQIDENTWTARHYSCNYTFYTNWNGKPAWNDVYDPNTGRVNWKMFE